MRITHLIALVTTFISAWLLPSCAATGPTPAAIAAEPACITVLYDAFGKDATMTRDWGYAALVAINGKRILFDTGGKPAIQRWALAPSRASNPSVAPP
jgi:7,8-dihydropterin-6-yl-methyl-4-(beta-D-ribofuranosyl)aminobenzene 5'-phosphate synthase